MTEKEAVVMLNPGTKTPITDVTSAGGYRLSIRFSDEQVTEIDFEPFLRASKYPDIRKFLDSARFEAYRIEWGNIVRGDHDAADTFVGLQTSADAVSVAWRTVAAACPHGTACSALPSPPCFGILALTTFSTGNPAYDNGVLRRSQTPHEVRLAYDNSSKLLREKGY